MSKIGIIAGGGQLPILIGEKLIQSGNSVVFFCIDLYAKKMRDEGNRLFPEGIEITRRILESLK